METVQSEAQGLCMICGQPEIAVLNGRAKKLAFDHDHTTGHLRGLLCQTCNTSLERFDSVPDFAAKVAAYLRRYTS